MGNTTTCPRCKGQGRGPWRAFQGLCFRCGGAGFIDREAEKARKAARVRYVTDMAAIDAFAGTDHTARLVVLAEYNRRRTTPDLAPRRVERTNPELVAEAAEFLNTLEDA